MPADHSQDPPSRLPIDQAEPALPTKSAPVVQRTLSREVEGVNPAVTPDCAGAGAVSECELAKILAYQEWPFAPIDARRYWAENEWRRWVRQARDILSKYDVRRRG